MTEEKRLSGRTVVGRGTSPNLALPAGGIRRPHLRRLTHWGRRRCGNAWSLGDIVAQNGAADFVSAADKDFTAKEIFRSGKRENRYASKACE